MTAEGHDIPSWFMPSGDQFLGEPRGGAEAEHVEEHGEPLPGDLCPHCGDEYEKETSAGSYVHSWAVIEEGDWERDENQPGWSKADRVRPGVWCAGGEKHSQLSRKYE